MDKNNKFGSPLVPIISGIVGFTSFLMSQFQTNKLPEYKEKFNAIFDKLDEQLNEINLLVTNLHKEVNSYDITERVNKSCNKINSLCKEYYELNKPEEKAKYNHDQRIEEWAQSVVAFQNGLPFYLNQLNQNLIRVHALNEAPYYARLAEVLSECGTPISTISDIVNMEYKKNCFIQLVGYSLYIYAIMLNEGEQDFQSKEILKRYIELLQKRFTEQLEVSIPLLENKGYIKKSALLGVFVVDTVDYFTANYYAQILATFPRQDNTSTSDYILAGGTSFKPDSRDLGEFWSVLAPEIGEDKIKLNNSPEKSFSEISECMAAFTINNQSYLLHQDTETRKWKVRELQNGVIGAEIATSGQISEYTFDMMEVFNLYYNYINYTFVIGIKSSETSLRCEIYRIYGNQQFEFACYYNSPIIMENSAVYTYLFTYFSPQGDLCCFIGNSTQYRILKIMRDTNNWLISTVVFNQCLEITAGLYCTPILNPQEIVTAFGLYEKIDKSLYQNITPGFVFNGDSDQYYLFLGLTGGNDKYQIYRLPTESNNNMEKVTDGVLNNFNIVKTRVSGQSIFIPLSFVGVKPKISKEDSAKKQYFLSSGIFATPYSYSLLNTNSAGYYIGEINYL